MSLKKAADPVPRKRAVRSVRGSFSVEAALVFSVVFTALSAAIRFAFLQRDLTLSGMLLNEGALMAARVEAVYDPDGLSEDGIREELKGRFSSVGTLSRGEVSAHRGVLKARSSIRTESLDLSSETPVFNPESTLRLSTSTEEFLQKNKYRKGKAKDAPGTE